jgi:hypothetical protein
MINNYFVLPFKNTNGKYKKALDAFIDPFLNYLNTNLNNYQIIIVEQSEKNILFNLGRTINIGFDLMKESMKENDSFFFHPVDILPIDVDYNISKTTKFSSYRHSPTGEYYKAIGFKIKDYYNINGFTNECWGWGAEDDEMKIRLDIKSIELDVKINNYTELCDDGNGTETIPHYSPMYHTNLSFSEKLKNNKNLLYSGLNTLKYDMISMETYKGIYKYTVD